MTEPSNEELRAQFLSDGSVFEINPNYSVSWSLLNSGFAEWLRERCYSQISFTETDDVKSEVHSSLNASQNETTRGSHLGHTETAFDGIKGIRYRGKCKNTKIGPHKYTQSTLLESESYIALHLRDSATQDVNIIINSEPNQPFCCPVCDKTFTCPCQSDAKDMENCIIITKRWDKQQRIFSESHTLHVCSMLCKTIANRIESSLREHILLQAAGYLKETTSVGLRCLVKARYIAKIDGIDWHGLTMLEKRSYIIDLCKHHRDWHELDVQFMSLEDFPKSPSRWDMYRLQFTLTVQFPSNFHFTTDAILDVLLDAQHNLKFDTLVPFLRSANLDLTQPSSKNKLGHCLCHGLLRLHGWNIDFVRYLKEANVLDITDVLSLVNTWKTEATQDLEELFSPLHLALEHGWDWRELITVFNPCRLDAKRRNVLHICAQKNLNLFVDVLKLLPTEQCCEMLVQRDDQDKRTVDYLDQHLLLHATTKDVQKISP